MSIAIRAASLDQDRELLIQALYRYLTPLSTPERFDWLYRSNPNGLAKAWLAVESGTQAVIGVAAAFPRRVYVGVREEIAWVLGDFCVSDRYRTLGPALQLQRACLAGLETNNVSVCYDFPSPVMMAVYKRLGIEATRRIVRLAKPLRVDRKLRRLINSSFALRALSFAGNRFMVLRDRARKHCPSLTVTAHAGRCGEEFSTLARSTGATQGACIVRSAEYLNWRYLDNPLHRYQFITARRGGNLLGYAVFLESREDGMIVDLFGINNDNVVGALIAHGIARMTESSVQSISAPLIETHPLRAVLERHGFRPRDSHPLVIFTPRASSFIENPATTQSWHIMHGDRDG